MQTSSKDHDLWKLIQDRLRLLRSHCDVTAVEDEQSLEISWSDPLRSGANLTVTIHDPTTIIVTVCEYTSFDTYSRVPKDLVEQAAFYASAALKGGLEEISWHRDEKVVATNLLFDGSIQVRSRSNVPRFLGQRRSEVFPAYQVQTAP